MTKRIRILLADDHPIYREGLRKILGVEPSFEVVDEVGDGQQALQRIRTLRPHVALMDVNMPVLDGLGVARACRKERLDCALIFLTMHRDESLLQEAIAAGVRGSDLRKVGVIRGKH
jgi:two-component system, NarL family, response regulator DegU